MKRLILVLIAVAAFFIPKAQLYNPSLHTVTNKALGVAQANPTDARTFYYDATLFKYRPYQSTAEALTYLNLQKYRVGNFPIIINLTGTLQPDGSYTDSTVSEYWFEGCVADTCLKVKSSGGGGGGSGTVTSVASGWGLDGGTITTTGTLTVDSINEVTSKLRSMKIADSLGAIIATKGVGTVTEVTVGWGTTALPDPITTTGFIGVDSGLVASRVRVQKAVDSLGAVIAAGGSGSLNTIYVSQRGDSGDTLTRALNDSTLWASLIRDSTGIDIVRASDGALTIRNTAPATNTTSFQSIINALGAGVIAQTFDVQFSTATVFHTLSDRQCDFVSIYISSATTLTGVKWIQHTAGNYTGDQYNGWGLFSYSGGTLTLVASTTNDANIWKGTSGTSQSVAFSSTYSAAEGVYFLAALYNQSAQTTAPVLKAKTSNGSNTSSILTNSAKLGGYTLANNSLAASLAISTVTDNPIFYWASVYQP
jgi:hypothetical protein